MLLEGCFAEINLTDQIVFLLFILGCIFLCWNQEVKIHVIMDDPVCVKVDYTKKKLLQNQSKVSSRDAYKIKRSQDSSSYYKNRLGKVDGLI